jgi:hypothetical protein
MVISISSSRNPPLQCCHPAAASSLSGELAWRRRPTRPTRASQQRWPELTRVAIHHRGAFSYLDGVIADGATLKLCRLRYTGSGHNWGFAMYRASHDDYQESVFPTGLPGQDRHGVGPFGQRDQMVTSGDKPFRSTCLPAIHYTRARFGLRRRCTF